MKNYFLIFCFSFIPISCQARTTIEVGEAKEHYSTFINKLRGKVDDFLKLKSIEMLNDIQELRTRNLRYEADYFETQDQYMYERIDERFNNEFERIARKFNAGIHRLDDMDAPDKVKQQFVKALKQQATASINALMQHYG